MPKKRLFPFFVLLLLFNNSSYSQANLQFNQAVSIETTISSGTYTVYTEFASIYSNSSGVTNMGVKINNVAIYSRNGGAATTGRPGVDHLGVVWCKAGDQIQFFSSGAGYTSSGFVSAIEFNLAP
jgi:hypothetical protein